MSRGRSKRIGPYGPPWPLPSDAARFWQHVEATATCWLWKGSTSQQGYGRFNVRGKVWSAHRVALFLDGVEVPCGLQVDHLCYQPSCVRPSHLQVVTAEINRLRAVDHRRRTIPARVKPQRGPQNGAKTHCHRGHRFTPETTYHPRKGHPRRMCLPCLRERDAARRVGRSS